jgi:hypothetical protein
MENYGHHQAFWPTSLMTRYDQKIVTYDINYSRISLKSELKHLGLGLGLEGGSASLFAELC